MNSYQAKRIPLKDILAALGNNPAQEVRGELWYQSPFRKEAEPSFKINQERNIWYDFGLGKGGNVIDFVQQYFRLGTVPGALAELERLMGGASGSLFPASPLPAPSPVPPAPPAPVESMEVRKIQPVQSRALLEYLRSRAIPAEIARDYVQEMHYARGGKSYFGLAFPNRGGGYELRNPYFKGSHGRKDISLLGIPADDVSPAVTHIAVFEGFMDFLSAVVHSGGAAPVTPAIVLNSAAMRDRAVEWLAAREVGQVDLYFDRDMAGRELTTHFQNALSGATVNDRSALYAGYKDFNAFLMDRDHHRG